MPGTGTKNTYIYILIIKNYNIIRNIWVLRESATLGMQKTNQSFLQCPDFLKTCHYFLWPLIYQASSYFGST